MKISNNKFWAVYNKQGRVMAISSTIKGAKEGALVISDYRWNNQTFDEIWGYLLKDGWVLIKSKIVPLEGKGK